MTRTRKKELLLVNISPSKNIFVRLVAWLMLRDAIPASLLVLAGLTPRDYKVTFINQPLAWRKESFSPDILVGITCLTANALEAYALAGRFRAAGASVVMGGAHVTAVPEEAAEHCDSVVVGEAESVWGQVLKDFEAGALQKIYRGVPLDDFFSPVFPYFKELPAKRLRQMGITITRGCRYRCDFCVLTPGKPRSMNLDQAVELCRKADSWVPIHFGDNNIYTDPEFAKEFFRRLIPLRTRWLAQATIDMAFDREALELARESGCEMLLIGIETIRLSQFPKNSVKGMRTQGDYIRALRNIRARGIRVIGSFIVGLDQDSHADYFRLLWFMVRACVQCPFAWVAISVLTPFPGSALFDRYKREGRLLTDRWDKHYTPYRVVFQPKTMSPWAVTAWFFVLRIWSILFSTTGLLFVIAIAAALWFDYALAHPRTVAFPQFMPF